MKVGVIGCGGIGSYFVQHVDRLIELKQIPDMKFTFFDDDIVETKNILYQNFEPCDVDSKKVEALELRYFNVEFSDKRCNQKHLSEFELVILCADNNLIRREAYNNFIENKIPFIDARANGKVIGVYSSDTPDYISTIDDSSKPQSRQNPFQIARKEIEYGNVVVAAALAQAVLNFHRKEKLPNDLLISF